LVLPPGVCGVLRVVFGPHGAQPVVLASPLSKAARDCEGGEEATVRNSLRRRR